MRSERARKDEEGAGEGEEGQEKVRRRQQGSDKNVKYVNTK